MTLYRLYEKCGSLPLVRFVIVIIMNIVLYPLMLAWTLVGVMLFPLGYIFMTLVMGRSVLWMTRKCVWIYGRVWQLMVGLFVDFDPIEIPGRPFDAPGIMVVNHRSYFDTYCMNMLPICDVCFAVRDWPFKIPIYSLFMKLAGYINIERNSWDETLEIAQKNIDNKRFILFFPEGHRARGNAMTRFYSGAFKLAVEHHVPVIPVCITGTQDLLPPTRYYLKPARIKMHVLDPVRPDQFNGETGHLELQKAVKEKMARHLPRMEAAAGEFSGWQSVNNGNLS